MRAVGQSVVMMMDSRNPLAILASVDEPFSLRNSANLTIFFTYYLNLKFACHHGLRFRYLQLIGGGCDHPQWGRRHPSYCKLAAVAQAMLDRDASSDLGPPRHVVFLDSDAFWRDTALSIPQLLQQYSVRPMSRSPRAIASFGWDSPYSLGPNGGFFVLSSGREAHSLLRTWWVHTHDALPCILPF
jgi:hypothetical protein